MISFKFQRERESIELDENIDSTFEHFNLTINVIVASQQWCNSGAIVTMWFKNRKYDHLNEIRKTK